MRVFVLKENEVYKEVFKAEKKQSQMEEKVVHSIVINL